MINFLNSQTVLQYVSLLNVIATALILGRILLKENYKRKGDIGFICVILADFMSALWSIALIHIGLTDWMVWWRVSYAVLFIMGLVLLFFSDDP